MAVGTISSSPSVLCKRALMVTMGVYRHAYGYEWVNDVKATDDF
jgi:hypothetical protein